MSGSTEWLGTTGGCENRRGGAPTTCLRGRFARALGERSGRGYRICYKQRRGRGFQELTVSNVATLKVVLAGYKTHSGLRLGVGGKGGFQELTGRAM